MSKFSRRAYSGIMKQRCFQAKRNEDIGFSDLYTFFIHFVFLCHKKDNYWSFFSKL